MFKYFLCFLLAVGSAGVSFAQSGADTLLMVPDKGGAYFYHVVTSKQTIYSLSREFDVAPGKLASFNDLTLKSPLKLYQLLRIPLLPSNLDQSTQSPASGMIPLYHKVMNGETLYHIGQLQGKVPVTLLRTWNHLKGNSLRQGQFLVVGWLKKADGHPQVATTAPAAGNKQASPDTGVTPEVTAGTPSPAPQAKKMVHRENNGGFLGEVIASENEKGAGNVGSGNEATAVPAPSENSTVTSATHLAPPVPRKEDAFTVTPAPAHAGTSPTRPKVSLVPGNTEVTDQTLANTAASGEALSAPTQKTAVPEKPDSFELLLNRVTHGPVTPSGASPATPSPAAAVPAGAGIPATDTPGTVKSEFQAQYDQQTGDGSHVATEKGAAGWFRSNVKPGSGRYYALCNDLPRGTVVRVVNPINQRSVLAKVLDGIPKQKDNYNLIIKLSDAAMGDLGVTQSRFWCELNYMKKDQ